MYPALLTLNAGSSSLKFSLFAIINASSIQKIFYGQIESLKEKPNFLVKNDKGEEVVKRTLSNKNIHKENLQAFALNMLLTYLKDYNSNYRICAVGHRVVHGGKIFQKPTIVNSEIILKLAAYEPLAPLHQPYNLAGIKILSELIPDVLQVACFDTAFHATQSDIAQAYALPEGLAEVPIKRYGFHGLSYEYIAQVIPHYLGREKAEGKIIVAHLGHGASLCAMKYRKSVATSMGFTALEGLPMGTRCGSLDPGIILYLLQRGMSIDEVTELLYKQSGLKGISQISGDMRDLLSSAQPLAKKAIDIFIYRIQCELGSLMSALEGLDSLIFTAGIGEHSPEVRSRLCEKMIWLPLVLNGEANQRNDLEISQRDSKISIWVIPTDEELIIAQHTFELWKQPQYFGDNQS